MSDIGNPSAKVYGQRIGACGNLHGLTEQPVVARTALVRGARRLSLRRRLGQKPLLLDGPASVVVGGQAQILGGCVQRGLVVFQQAQIVSLRGRAEVAVDHAPLGDLFVVPQMLVSVCRAVQHHLIPDALSGQNVAALRRRDDVILPRHQLVYRLKGLVGGDLLGISQGLDPGQLGQCVPSRRSHDEGHRAVLDHFG